MSPDSYPAPMDRDQLAARVAKDLEDGWCVNLGIGLPLLLGDHLADGLDIQLHSENGILGMGPRAKPGAEDWDLVNAGKEPVTLRPGGSFFTQADAFAMIRGGYIDVAVIGAFQVSEEGDLANWRLPSQKLGNVGGAMDLVAGARRVWAVMTHFAKDGRSKIVARCDVPLTRKACVTRIFTDVAVIDVTDRGLVLVEPASGWTSEQVREVTDAKLHLAR